MAQESLNVVAPAADGQGMVDTAVTLSPWASFMDRFGVTAHVAVLGAMVSMCLVQLADVRVADAVPGLQMLLLLVALGCVGVLSYRSHEG